MHRKLIPLILLMLAGSLYGFANSGGKEKKDDPDLTGLIVAAETGKPLRDVSITAYNNSRKEKSVSSNASGNFSLADLKPGTYKFVFEKDGFEKVVREKIVLKTKEDYQITIQMFEEESIFDLIPSPLHLSSSE